MKFILFIIGSTLFLVSCSPHLKPSKQVIRSRIYSINNAKIEKMSFVTKFDKPLKANEKEVLVFDYIKKKFSSMKNYSNGEQNVDTNISRIGFNMWFKDNKYIEWFPDIKMKTSGSYLIQNDTLIMNSIVQGKINYSIDASLIIYKAFSSSEDKSETNIILFPIENYSNDSLNKILSTYKTFTAKIDILQAISDFTFDK